MPALTVSRSAAGDVCVQARWIDAGRLLISGSAQDNTDMDCVSGAEMLSVPVSGGRFQVEVAMPQSGLVRLAQGSRVSALVYATQNVLPLQVSGDALPDLPRAVFGLAEKWELPGLSLCDVVDGEPPACFCAGPATMSLDTPIVPESRFRIGSLSKLVTAILIHRLADEGRIDPNERASRYLPVELGEVTVRDLLSNCSGLTFEVDGAWPFIDSASLDETACPSQQVPEETVKALLASASLNAQPTGGFSYLTANFWILGRIAEAVTGMAYAELAMRYVFAPAGITGASIGASFPDRGGTHEVHYFAQDRALSAPASALGLRDPVPAAYATCVSQRDAMGGWVMSAADLARLCGQTETLLGSDNARAAFWGGSEGGIAAGPWRWGQGCFLQPQPESDRPVWWIFGGMDGACGLVARFPGRTVAVLSNGTPPDRDLFLAALWRTIHRDVVRGTRRR